MKRKYFYFMIFAISLLLVSCMPVEEVTKPSAPSNLSAEVLSSTEIKLTWQDNSTNEEGFKIERKEGETGSFNQITTVEANITEYTDSELSPNTTYYYRVRAYNSGGDSNYSNEINATTHDVAPNAPSNLSAEVVSSTEIKLTWADNSTNEEGFKIERKTASTEWNQITTVEANITEYTDSELSPNTTYYYRVRAYNSGGDSNYSNEVNATTHDVAPNAPSNLGAEVLSSSEIKLTWADNSTNEEGFKIERKTASTEWSQITTVVANITEYTDNELSPNTKYYYRVRAYNNGGDSNYSNEINATTHNVAPNAPTNLSAEVLSSSEIKLTWTDNSTNEEGFKIERKTASTEWSQITTVVANITEYTDNELSPNTTYYYRVRAYNSVGDSNYSNEVNATTYDVAPNAPTNLSAEVLSSSEIKLTWTDNSTNEEGFKIERKTASTEWSQITTVVANITEYTDNELSPNTKYYYRVRAYNNGGDSNYSNEVNATTYEDITSLIGTKKWDFYTSFPIKSSPAIAEDGTIYIGSEDGTLYALDPNGSEKWHFSTDNWITSTPAISADGTIYALSYDGKFYAINPDGSKKWEFEVFGGDSSPAIAEDGTIYICSGGGTLYAINPDGTEKWKITIGGAVSSSPAIGDDGTIYLGSMDRKLYAINPNGSKKWDFQTGYDITSSPAIADDGTIYIGSWDKKLYAINPDGTEKWTFQTGDWIKSSPAIAPDGTIYVGSNDGYLYAINPDGTQKWAFIPSWMEWSIESSPAVGSDGTIYVGVLGGGLYAINPDGTKKWEFKADSHITSSPSIGEDGTVYVGSWDEKFYAIYGNSEGLANSSWPKFRKNARNTGNVND